MAAQSKERQSSFTHNVRKSLRGCFYLHNCFNFPLSTAGGEGAELLPLGAVAEVLGSQGLACGGGGGEGEGKDLLSLLSSQGSFTPCPLSLTSIHPAPRGWFPESRGGSGIAAGPGGWSQATGWGLWPGWRAGRLALGTGPGWIIFLAIVGLNVHSSLPVQAGNSIALSICVCEHVCGMKSM